MAEVKGAFILMGIETLEKVAKFKLNTVLEKLEEKSGLKRETIKPDAWYKTEDTLCVIVESCAPITRTLMGREIYPIFKVLDPEFLAATGMTDPLSALRGLPVIYDYANKPRGAFKVLEAKPGYCKLKDSSAHAPNFMKGLHEGILKIFGAKNFTVEHTIQADGSRIFKDTWSVE